MASGVEAVPGVKDHALMAEFAERAESTAGGTAVSGVELEPGR